MPDTFVPRDEKSHLLRIEHRPLDVVSGEAADGLLGVPQRDQEEFRLVAGDAAQREHAAMPGVVRSVETAAWR